MNARKMESKLQCLEDQLCLSRGVCKVPVKAVTIVPNASPADQYDVIEEDVLTLSDAKQLADRNSNVPSQDFAARLLCFSQTNSHRPVNVTKSVLHELLLTHNVSGEFLEVIGGFHWKDITVEEALGTPFWTKYSKAADVLEYIFVYKYPERTDRKGAEPWTIRQSAFYHQIRISDKRSLYITISPYQNTETEEMVRHWLRDVASMTYYHRQVLQPAVMLLSSRLDEWRQYMKHYEREITQVWTLVFCAGSEYPESVTYDSLRNLHFFQNKLNPVAAIFGSLIGTLDGLHKIPCKHDMLLAKNSDEAQNWQEFIYNSRMKLSAFQMNINSVMAHCQSTLQFVDGAIKLDNQRIIGRQSSHVLNLTGIAVDDSATIRVMTTITLIFLSFATIAAIMAMPIFYLNETKSLAVSSSWWIYLLLALLVTALTVTFWRWSLRRKREARVTELDHEKRRGTAV